MPFIGIFWVHGDTIFGRRIDVERGVEAVDGRVDADVDHATVWDDALVEGDLPSGLDGLEYLAIPRGRVLFDRRRPGPLVYLDRRLMNELDRQRIAAWFGFDIAAAAWRADPHYTTSRVDLRGLFD